MLQVMRFPQRGLTFLGSRTLQARAVSLSSSSSTTTSSSSSSKSEAELSSGGAENSDSVKSANFSGPETAARLTEEEILAKQNIARIAARTYDRKVRGVYHAKFPTEFSERQLRADFVTFGRDTGINGGVCWPTKEQMADLHYIDAKFRPSFEELRERIETRKREAADEILAREQEIDDNINKLTAWRQAMLDKEEKAMREERERKAIMAERIREVREYIGYNVSPTDPKFIEVMEMKEAQRKAAEKELKKQAKKARMMEKLMNLVKVTDEKTAPETTSADARSGSEPAGSDTAESSSAGRQADQKPVKGDS